MYLSKKLNESFINGSILSEWEKSILYWGILVYKINILQHSKSVVNCKTVLRLLYTFSKSKQVKIYQVWSIFNIDQSNLTCAKVGSSWYYLPKQGVTEDDCVVGVSPGKVQHIIW
jgi:hypothetical protein